MIPNKILTKQQVIGMRNDANNKINQLVNTVNTLTSALSKYEDDEKTAKISSARIKSDINSAKRLILEQKKRISSIDSALTKGSIVIKGVRYFVQ